MSIKEKGIVNKTISKLTETGNPNYNEEILLWFIVTFSILVLLGMFIAR